MITKEKISFDGSVAQNYDDLLGPFIFEPFALDIIVRIDASKAANVLEIACGTGRVTKHLTQRLPYGSTLTATDLNPGMIAIAKQRIDASNVKWNVVDMMDTKFENEQFDLIVCQFGVMFAPDKIKALSEMYRILKKGGKLIFNTWGNLDDNRIWDITATVVNSFLGDKPTGIFSDGPFCMKDEKTVVKLLEASGFKDSKVFSVIRVGELNSAEEAARGFILGLPVLKTINDQVPNSLVAIVETLTKEIAQQLGNHPVKASLHAWVFESVK